MPATKAEMFRWIGEYAYNANWFAVRAPTLVNYHRIDSVHGREAVRIQLEGAIEHANEFAAACKALILIIGEGE